MRTRKKTGRKGEHMTERNRWKNLIYIAVQYIESTT